MFTRLLFIVLVALGTSTIPLDAGWFDSITGYFNKPTAAKPPKMRVLVVHDQQGVVVEVKGKYKMYDPNTGGHISTRFVGKRKFMQAVRDGLKWGEEFPGLYQLLIVPEDNSTTIVDGIEYKGPIFIYDIGGTISVVNEISIEDYLSSILARNQRPDMPKELLAASVIAARTSAYYAAANPKNQYWSVDAAQVGYQGFAVADPKSEVEKAIKETRYMVMSFPNGNEINAFPVEWKTEASLLGQKNVSKITFEQADEMAKKGEHAAQILMKAFPGVKIELIHYPSEKQ